MTLSIGIEQNKECFRVLQLICIFNFSFLCFQLQQDIQVRSNEAQREGRKKDKLERELRQARADLEQRTQDMKTLQGQIERYKQDMGKTEQQLKEQRVSYRFHWSVSERAKGV